MDAIDTVTAKAAGPAPGEVIPLIISINGNIKLHPELFRIAGYIGRRLSARLQGNEEGTEKQGDSKAEGAVFPQRAGGTGSLSWKSVLSERRYREQSAVRGAGSIAFVSAGGHSGLIAALRGGQEQEWRGEK